MGVTGLWSILDDLSEKKDLSFLSGKRVAVDLSGWVVQAIQCKGLNKAKNPHLRNLFFRVSLLLQKGVHPIFIMEGKIPALKAATFKERNHQGCSRGDDVSRSMFDRILNECQDLLRSLGVPCIKSSGEAEAFCAFLCAKKIVEGVITEDNDAFLYGADTVFREFTIERADPHVKLYSLKSTKNKLCLDQSKLVALALLLGCDYGKKGVQGIGKESVLKLASDLQGCDLLQRFKDWKEMDQSELFPGYDEAKAKKKIAHCKRCSHIGSDSKHKKEGCSMCNSEVICDLSVPENPCSCEWCKNEKIHLKRKTELKIYNAAKKDPHFPNEKVIEEYMNYTDVIPDEDNLQWNCPNLKEFQEKAFNYLGWTLPHSHEKCFPIITSWQLFKLTNGFPVNEPSILYKPVKVLKARTVKGEESLEIQWTLIGSNTLNSEDHLRTIENKNRFMKSYPEIAEVFCNSPKKPKIETQSKRKVKTFTPPKGNRKVIPEPVSHSVPNLTPRKDCQPNMLMNSPASESSESFSYLPLYERIKIASKALHKNECKSSESNTLSIQCAQTPIGLARADDFESVTSKFNFDHNLHDSNTISTSPCSSYHNTLPQHYKGVESITETHSDLKTINSDLKNDLNLLYGINNTCLNVKQRVSDASVCNAIFCLEFTDSEESSLNICYHTEKEFNNLDCRSTRKSLVLVNDKNFNLETEHLNNTGSCLKNQQSFLNTSYDYRTKSPRLLYSLNQITCDTSYVWNNSALSGFIYNSTPKTKQQKSISRQILCLSALKSSKMFSYNDSIQLFSPVIFDSSKDDSIVCLN